MTQTGQLTHDLKTALTHLLQYGALSSRDGAPAVELINYNVTLADPRCRLAAPSAWAGSPSQALLYFIDGLSDGQVVPSVLGGGAAHALHRDPDRAFSVRSTDGLGMVDSDAITLKLARRREGGHDLHMVVSGGEVDVADLPETIFRFATMQVQVAAQLRAKGMDVGLGQYHHNAAALFLREADAERLAGTLEVDDVEAPLADLEEVTRPVATALQMVLAHKRQGPDGRAADAPDLARVPAGWRNLVLGLLDGDADAMHEAFAHSHGPDCDHDHGSHA